MLSLLVVKFVFLLYLTNKKCVGSYFSDVKLTASCNIMEDVVRNERVDRVPIKCFKHSNI